LKLLPRINFINILRTRFLYESALSSYSLVTFWQKKHFCTKNAYIKCWWNWPPVFFVRCGVKIFFTNHVTCYRKSWRHLNLKLSRSSLLWFRVRLIYAFSISTRCQFHQRSMCSFYAHRSRKRKKIYLSKSSVSFYAFGIWEHKAVRWLMKLSPSVNFINVLHTDFLCADPKSAKKNDNLTVFLCFWDLDM